MNDTPAFASLENAKDFLILPSYPLALHRPVVLHLRPPWMMSVPSSICLMIP